LLVGAAVAAIALRAATASAEPVSVDPSYGRIDGDLDVVLGAGVVIAPRMPRADGELRLLYLQTAGVLAAYEEGRAFGSAGDPERALVLGFEMRPLFLVRWLKGHEVEHAWFDLALDSIGLGVGAVLQQPPGRGFASQRAMQVALGIELPLMARATGLWVGIRGGLRWSEAALASGSVLSADDRQATLALTLSWHQLIAAHVVDWGDRAVR
jgi:hypothetical protein